MRYSPREGERIGIAASASAAAFHGLFLETDLATRRARIGGRRNDASDADDNVAQQQEAYGLGPMDWTRIDASGTPEDTLERVRVALAHEPKLPSRGGRHSGLLRVFSISTGRSRCCRRLHRNSQQARRSQSDHDGDEFAIALSAPFAGAIADVLGRKRVIVAAMIVSTLPLVMIALAPSLPLLIFWRFLLGLALPPIFTVVVAYIGEEWPASQAIGATGAYMAASTSAVSAAASSPARWPISLAGEAVS